MIIEKLILDYLAIPNEAKSGFGFRLELARIDGIAARARYKYCFGLRFFIRDLIKQENNAALLKHIIEVYGDKLVNTHDLIFILYKKYLTIEWTDEQFYKKLAELIILHRAESEGIKAKKMSQFAAEHNFEAALEILNLFN